MYNKNYVNKNSSRVETGNTEEDKFAILNVTNIINMLEEAKYKGYGDVEQMYFTIDELISILSHTDDIRKIGLVK